MEPVLQFSTTHGGVATHVLDVVRISALKAEPRAITALPLDTANHAELRTASTSHMIASFLEFNHGSAFVAPLPAFVLGLLQEPGSFFVPWAPSRVVPFAIAGYTNLRFATATASHLTSRITVAVDVGWLDPFATLSHWAVHAIPCRVFGKLAVPRLLERAIEQLVHVV